MTVHTEAKSGLSLLRLRSSRVEVRKAWIEMEANGDQYVAFGKEETTSPAREVDPYVCLNEFRALAHTGTADPESVARFARNYGNLALCPHNQSALLPRCTFLPGCRHCLRRLNKGEWRESITAWIEHAAQLDAVVIAYAKLRGGQPIPAGELERLTSIVPLSLTRRLEPGAEAWRACASAVDSWLDRAFELRAMRPVLSDWNQGSPNLDVEAHWLLGLLAWALASLIVHPRQSQTCSVCGTQYLLGPGQWTPQERKQNFCGQPCRRKAKTRAERERKQRRRLSLLNHSTA